MLSEAVVFLRNELRKYLVANRGTIDMDLSASDIILGNIAALESAADPSQLAGKVITTVANIEEESTLKNGQRYIKNPIENGIEYINPPVFLNLYILFTATLSEGNPDPAYERALHRISLIMEFFQSKKSFTVQNSPGSSPGGMSQTDSAELRLYPELYTLTFEQINHLWGSLGGKQVPFVMYKFRLVKIQGRIITDAPVIEEVREKSEEAIAKELAQLP